MRRRENTETQGLAAPIINHYMLMSFHTQRSVCVFACLSVYSHRLVHECVCVCVCVSQRTGGQPLQHTNTSEPQTIYANPSRSLKSTSFTFSLHFPINIKHYYNEMGFFLSPSPHTHTPLLLSFISSFSRSSV